VSLLEQPQSGRAWTVGDSVDTSQLAGGGLVGDTPQETLRLNCLRIARPDFADGVRPGDVLVGGHNFGCGSSRQTAAEALVLSGIAVVLVESAARIFRRNCVAVGLPLLIAPDITGIARDGEEIVIDYPRRQVTVPASGAECAVWPWSDGVAEIYAQGGLSRVIAARLTAAGHAPDPTEECV
jgi:3-isopropylmalate/(R)-2-methylmalate dehydratase small subunit